MDSLALILIAIGLAMDAFAVSICKGLAMKEPDQRSIVIIALWFGVFQAVMPIIGYLLERSVHDIVADYDHWIAFILLAAIGLNMIRESLSKKEEELSDDISFWTMLFLAIATSIDALAVGISLAVDGGDVVLSVLVIGIVTFALSAVGVRFGSFFGNKYGRYAELAGGIILILIGVKILLEHTGYL